MRILIVGGASFIGAYTARRLLRRGHDVVAYDLNVVDNAIHRVLNDDERAGVRLVGGDVLDALALAETVRDHRIEAIIHLAAALGPECARRPALATRVNCDGLNHSLELARLFGLRRVVWASSTGVFGPPARYDDAPPDEDAPLFPPTLYGATKAFNEHVARHYHAQFGVDAIGLRFPIVYGPGRMRGALPYELWRELVEKPAAGLPGRVPMADSVIDWQYVEDTAEALVLAALHPGTTADRVFNTCGDVRPVRDAVAIVQRLLPGADLVAVRGAWDVLGRLDTRRVEAQLAYAPQYPLERGLEESIAALRGWAGPARQRTVSNR